MLQTVETGILKNNGSKSVEFTSKSDTLLNQSASTIKKIPYAITTVHKVIEINKQPSNGTATGRELQAYRRCRGNSSACAQFDINQSDRCNDRP